MTARLSQHPALSVVDLFAGCGGLALGLEQAGFTSVFCCELDDDARRTYLQNRYHSLGGLLFGENRDLHCADAAELTLSRLRQLKSDLGQIPELQLSFDESVNPRSGGGSTLDVVAGGPPCQGFSMIGTRRSYSVDGKDIPANLLYRQMARVIALLRPRIFLFENVRGLLHARWTRGGRFVFPDVLASFRSIPGYEVRWSLVSARSYGVPQNRPRVLIVGVRKDVVESCWILRPMASADDVVLCRFLPRGKRNSFPDLVDLLGDLVDENIAQALRCGEFPRGPFETTEYPSKAKTHIQRTLRRRPAWASGERTKLTEQQYSKHRPRTVEKYDHMLSNGGLIPPTHQTRKFSQKVLPARWGEVGPTITATSLPDDYVHFCQPRNLTVREWARLQLFPDWYRFAGTRTTGGLRRAGDPTRGIFDRDLPKYTQVANAVPVRLAEHVGKHFKRILQTATG